MALPDQSNGGVARVNNEVAFLCCRRFSLSNRACLLWQTHRTTAATNAVATTFPRSFFLSSLDAAITAYYLRSVLSIFVVACFYAVVVLVPVQLSPGCCTSVECCPLEQPNAPTCCQTRGLLQLTLDHLPNGSPLFAFHVVAIYLYSFVAYYAFYRAYRKYASLRIGIMLRHSPENYTVIVRELPTTNARDEPFADADLRELFEFMFPGDVVGAYVAPHLVRPCDCRL